jgi:hypothetical protein
MRNVNYERIHRYGVYIAPGVMSIPFLRDLKVCVRAIALKSCQYITSLYVNVKYTRLLQNIFPKKERYENIHPKQKRLIPCC